MPSVLPLHSLLLHGSPKIRRGFRGTEIDPSFRLFLLVRALHPDPDVVAEKGPNHLSPPHLDFLAFLNNANGVSCTTNEKVAQVWWFLSQRYVLDRLSSETNALFGHADCLFLREGGETRAQCPAARNQSEHDYTFAE